MAPGDLLKAQRKFSGEDTGSEPAKPPWLKLSNTVTYCSDSGSEFSLSGIGLAWPWRGLPVAPGLTPSNPAAADPASVVTSVELISRSSLSPLVGSWLTVAVSGLSVTTDSSLTRSAAPSSSEADGSQPPSASHALLAQMKLFLPASALVSG